MSDTVSTQIIADTSGVKYVTKLTNISDGTGETNVTKVDASATIQLLYYYQVMVFGI